MYENQFSAWVQWNKRDELPQAGCPGVYVVALTARPLAGSPFSWTRSIVYVGMTNARSGLRGRLRKFDRTLSGESEHGGADRVRFKHRDADAFRTKAYVSIANFVCDPGSNRPKDLRIMGKVARFEYECLAHFVERFKRLPEFNDKTRSPKDGDNRWTDRRRRRRARRRQTSAA